MSTAIIKASDKINALMEKTAISLLAIVTVLTFSGVIFRYAFGSPIIWLYETTLVLFSWVTFLGISIAVKKNEHIHLDFVFHKLSIKHGALLARIIAIITILFFLIIFKDSIEIVMETFGQKYNTINLSTGWFYIPLLICSFTSLIHLFSRLFEVKGETK